MKAYVPISILLALIISAALLFDVARLSAAPAALTCGTNNAAITSPQSGATLNGVVQIEGTASLGDQFQYYKLEFSPGGDNFTVFSGLIRQQVNAGQLAVWDSASVPDGVYSIRLRVVDATGNYCDVVVSGLKVQNSTPITPTEAPTPVDTEAPPVENVVPTAVPTIQIGAPTEPGRTSAATEAATPSGTRTPGGVTLIPGGFSTDSIFTGVRQAFGSLARIFFFGAVTMAGVVLVVGVIFFVRRVL